MKVLGINGSPHKEKSQTLKLVRAVLNGAEKEGAEVGFVDLCSLDILFCKGCRVCFHTGKCILHDDYEKLLEKMLSADGMVWGSPDFSFCVPAQMKVLIDRMADVIHCQYFDGKYSVAVATGGRDDKVITDYLKKVLLDFGSFVTGCTGAIVTCGPFAIKEAEKTAYGLGRKLAVDIKKKRIYPEQQKLITKNRKAFQKKIKENARAWKHEFEYWEERKWK